MSSRRPPVPLGPAIRKPRTRSKGAITPGALYSRYGRYDSCAHGSEYLIESTRVAGGVYEQMDDYVVDHFKRRSAAGETYFNSMKYSRVSHESLGGEGPKVLGNFVTCGSQPSWRAVYDWRGDHFVRWLGQGYALGSPTPFTPPIYGLVSDAEIASLQTEVSTSLYNKRGRSDANLWESLAELNKTAEMLAGPISALFSLVTKAGRSDLKSSARRVNTFKGAIQSHSSLWLQWRYGVRPIISDIEAILEGLQKPTGIQRQTTRAKGSVSRQSSSVFSSTHDIVVVQINKFVEDSVTVRAMSLDDVLQDAFSNLGFTTKGLLTTPWELVPWSFVYDWFLNVGDFLGTMVPSVGWKQVGSTMTTIRGKLNVYQALSSSIRADYASQFSVTSSLSGGWRCQELTRTRGALATPGIVINSNFKFDKITRQADALALAVQKANRIFR